MSNTHSIPRGASGELQQMRVVPEIELYEELTAFTHLSPEQQQEYGEQSGSLVVAPEPSLTQRDGEAESKLEAGGGFDVVEISPTRPMFQRPEAASKSPAPADGVCPSCGVPNPSNDIFCPGCGAFLEDLILPGI
jgi:hypothetical protein